MDICPEVFEMEDDIVEVKVGEVSPEVEASCKEAAESCLSEAISIDG